MTIECARAALVNVLGDHWTRAVGRMTGEDLDRLGKLAEAELRYAALAAEGDVRAEDLRKEIEAQIVALAATVVVIEGRELDATLRKVLEIGRQVLVEVLKLAGAVALPT